MKKALFSISLLALFSFSKIDNQFAAPVKEYVQTRISEKLESFELVSVDTLTPKGKLKLHLSRLVDSLEIFKPVYVAAAKQKALTEDSYKKYPKDKSFKIASVDAVKGFDSISLFMDGIIERGHKIEAQLPQTDSISFVGYLTKSAVKYYAKGNRAVTVYDTATVVFDEKMRVIQKSEW